MGLLDRYVQAVKFWLPKTQRDDIAVELSEDIRSQMDEQEAGLGRKLSETEIASILKQRGRPLLVANRYLPQESLIGPVLFPVYRFVLKIVILCYLAPSLLVWIGMMGFDPGHRSAHSVAGALISVCGRIWVTALIAVGVVTIIFAILERLQSRSRILEDWDPRRLRPVRDPNRIPRYSSVLELAVLAVCIVWWVKIAWARPDFNLGGVTIMLAPVWRNFFWAYLLLALASIGLAGMNFSRPYWTRLRGGARLLIDGAGAAVSCWLLKAHLLTGISAPHLSPARAAVIVNAININMAKSFPFAAAILGTIIGLADVGRLIRLRSRRGQLIMSAAVLILLALAVAGTGAQAAPASPVTAGSDVSSPGGKLFQTRCASCHRPFNPVRAPWPSALQHMSQTSILAALEAGVMRPQATGLSRQQLTAIAEFLGQNPVSSKQTAEDLCTGTSNGLSGGAQWNGWGRDSDNSRSEPAQIAGLTRNDIPNLRLKWAFGIPGAASVGSQPTLFGGRIFLGGGDGLVYSLDARSGCVYWTYQPSAPSRTAISIGHGGRLAYFGDEQANVYAVDARTAALVWKVSVDQHPFAMITGAPKLYGHRLYVPVSSAEEVAGPYPQYPCCTFRGSLVALDAKTGRLLWKSYTISTPPRPTRKNSAGTQMFGPSGAAIWSSPTVDQDRQAVYVGTGDNYSDPGTATSDAVIAFDMDSGRILWVRQLTLNDRWNEACDAPDKSNCPQKPGWDFDIGASPILRFLPNGKRVLIVGQKSGIVYGLDPDHQGAILWQTRIGKGGALGGIEFGGAADGASVYIPLSDISRDPMTGGGLFSLDIRTGKKVWYAPPAKPDCLTRAGCSAAQEGPATLIPGTVLLGSLDGHLRAYDSRDGSVIWDYDTLREFRTVNGVKGSGGSICHGGPIAGQGMIFVGSGYSTNAGIPGNVVLAFSIDGKCDESGLYE